MLHRVKVYILLLVNLYAVSVFGAGRKERLRPSEAFVPLTGDFWNCSESNSNDAELLNLTCDCSSSNRKSGEIPLWANELLLVNSLTIQNCDKLVLQTQFFLDDDIDYEGVNLTSLRVQNVGELVLVGREDEFKMHSHFPSVWYEESKIVFPEKVVLENINHITFDFSNPSLKKFIQFSSASRRTKSFKLVNITINTPQLLQIGGTRSSIVEEFVMDKVQFRGHGEDSNQCGFILSFTCDFFKIANSNFTDMRVVDMNVWVNKANVTGNNFGLSSRNSRTYFIISGNIDISFSGNHLSVLGSENAFDMLSHRVNVTNNIFNYVSNRTFDINSYGCTSCNVNLSSILNFSNNVFHELSPSPFYFSGQNYFDEVIISNNSIDCSCENSNWFNNVKVKKEKHMYEDLLFSKNMSNTCTNIDNCHLSEVLNDVNGLCEPNYKCSHQKE